MMFRCIQAVAGAALVMLALLVAGCGGGADASSKLRSADRSSSPAAVSGLDLSAEVDAKNGSVTLPADRFSASYDEQQLLLAAQTAAFAECARSADIPWTGAKPITDPAYNMWVHFGPWTKTEAEKFGFVAPMSDRDLVENGIVPRSQDFVSGVNAPNAQLTDAQVNAATAKCQGDPESKKFDIQKLVTAGPWSSELTETYATTVKDPRAKKVFADLSACYSRNGMTFDSSRPGLVTAANETTIDEEQITLALKVVTCQQQTNATQRLADIMAAIQAPTIEKYAKELVAQRARIDKALTEAKAYTAAHPELFEAPQ